VKGDEEGGAARETKGGGEVKGAAETTTDAAEVVADTAAVVAKEASNSVST
jgi:hypothetical protein